MSLLAFLMLDGDSFLHDMLGSFFYAGIFCVFSAGIWTIFWKFDRRMQPMTHGLKLLAGSGLAMVAVTIAASSVLPLGPY